MNANEYQEETRRTDLQSYNPVIDRLRTVNIAQLIHAHLGLSSETGELADALKKHLIYGQPLDIKNVKEELGDKLWYISIACDACMTTLEEVMEANINKLKIRYPEKFTEKDAAERKDKRPIFIGGKLCDCNIHEICDICDPPDRNDKETIEDNDHISDRERI